MDILQAVKEASRCLQFDLRLQIGKVVSLPEELLKWTRDVQEKI